MLTKEIHKPAVIQQERAGEVHCLICSHRVPAQVLIDKRGPRVKPGEKCARCGSSLTSGCVLAIRPLAA